MAIALNKLVAALEPIAVTGNRRVEIESVCTDSRQVRPGALFAALQGLREDGWRYVPDALKRGAVAILSEHNTPRLQGGVCHIQVADVPGATGLAAALVNGNPSDALTLIAVTGTNGKTTTAGLIRDILTASGCTTGLIGTIQYEIGPRIIPATRTTPDAAALHSMFRQMKEIGCSHCVMEVSSHAIVQQRIAGIVFDYAVFTNLTRDHLDYHGSMESYFEAKARLFRGLPATASAVLNSDDEWCRRLAEEPLAAALLRYGFDAAADIVPTRVALDAAGVRFDVRTPQGAAAVSVPLLGRFNLYNALAAIAVCGAAGIALDTMIRQLAACRSAPGRLEPVATGRDFHVFVDYAHTDDALTNVLTALREIAPGRLVVVFGCGGNRDAGKRSAMGRVAATLADRVILTSDNPRREDPETIIADILAGIEDRGKVACIVSRGDAIRAAIAEARAGDLILVAGKGHEQYQELADRTVPFDDRQQVREALHAGL